MTGIQAVEALALLVGSLAVTIVARKLGWQPPLLLVAVGLAVSFVPGLPSFHIDPELVLVLIIPPLLYSASLDSSLQGFRANLRPIGLLAVALVLVTTVAVGAVAYLLIPDLSWPVALVLGALVAPPDAVSAVSIGKRLGLPRRVMTVLTGESLVNDATALTAYKVAIAAAIGAGTSLTGAVGTFLLAAAGGVVVGGLVGVVVHWVRVRLGDGVLESALGILVPFAAYLLAEEVHASGVLAVVVAGLYLGHYAPQGGYAMRLQDTAVWGATDTLLESLVFALIGLQLPAVLTDANDGGHATGPVLLASLAVLVTTMVVRVVWVFPATYLPRRMSRRLRARDPSPPWRVVAVLSWCGMRGVVSLAAAAAIPLTVDSGAPFPARDVVLLIAFVVTVGTLLVQGTTLPWLIRTLGVSGAEAQSDALAEAQVQNDAARASVSRLDEVLADGDQTPEHIVERLRTMAEHRGNAAWERLGRQHLESPAAAYRRLRRTMLAAEREVFVQARNGGTIDDEVLRRVLRELDLEEAALDRD